MTSDRSLKNQKQSVPQQLAAIDARLGKIERHMFWESIFAGIRLFIIITPIILAFIFIPPFVKKYTPILNTGIEKAKQFFVQFQNMNGNRANDKAR